MWMMWQVAGCHVIFVYNSEYPLQKADFVSVTHDFHYKHEKQKQNGKEKQSYLCCQA
jgi:hypothetical protein